MRIHNDSQAGNRRTLVAAGLLIMEGAIVRDEGCESPRIRDPQRGWTITRFHDAGRLTESFMIYLFDPSRPRAVHSQKIKARMSQTEQVVSRETSISSQQLTVLTANRWEWIVIF